ncbi:hypothetical protein C8R47DRAFT_220736 [Mycena vitilis]|nr:hypothetical protein C8R47DRAFT_220736 [Mycena vitilis]
MLTAQNHDLQFGTNVIGHFFFTELLLPALAKSYEEKKIPARVLHTSSIGHKFAPGNGMDFASLKGGSERDAWIKKKGRFLTPWTLYGESKIGNIVISNYFAKTHSDVLVSCSVHPGGIKTELSRYSAEWLQIIGGAFAHPAPMGAYTQLWGATVATPAQIAGQVCDAMQSQSVPWVGTYCAMILYRNCGNCSQFVEQPFCSIFQRPRRVSNRFSGHSDIANGTEIMY